MRTLLLILAIVLVGGFAAQNWGEINRSSELLFGPVVMAAPLGLILLSVLAIGLIAYLLSTSAIRTRALMESRHHHKTLEAQRELADKAEASRFTDLRTHLEKSQLDLRNEIASMNRSLMARMSELETRFDTRLRSTTSSWGGGSSTPVRQEERERREHALATDAELDRARAAEEAREAHLREERARTERAAGPGSWFRNWR